MRNDGKKKHWTTKLLSGRKMKRCGGCKSLVDFKRRRCDYCGATLVRRKAKKLKPGTMDRVRQDLKTAQRMADLWASKAKRAAGLLHYWNRRERLLAAKLAAGPQPPRPKKPRPPTRGIKLPKARVGEVIGGWGQETGAWGAAAGVL